MTNLYFIYEGQTLIAAQPKFTLAMKYFKKGRTIKKGNPFAHDKDLTAIANKLKFIQ